MDSYSKNDAATSVGDELRAAIAHRVYGADAWYVDRKWSLQPIAALIQQQNEDPSIINALTPILTPQDLSSADNLNAAFHAWHAYAQWRMGQGDAFRKGFSHEEVSEAIRHDLDTYLKGVPDYLNKYQKEAPAWAGKTASISDDIRATIVSNLQNEKLVPLPFAVILAYFGTAFVFSPDTPVGKATSKLAIVGKDFISDDAESPSASMIYLSGLVVRAVGSGMEALQSVTSQIKELLNLAPISQEVKTLIGKHFEDREGQKPDFLDIAGLFHALQVTKMFSALDSRWDMPMSTGGHRKFLNLVSIAATDIRPDLNNEIEAARVVMRGLPQDKTSLPDSQNAQSANVSEEILVEGDGSGSTQLEKALSTLRQAYWDIYPSARQLYREKPINFVLTGPDRAEYVAGLSFSATNKSLHVGSDYLDPAHIRQWMTGVPLERQPIRIHNLDEDRIRIAASLGVIKGALYAMYVQEEQFKRGTLERGFERELRHVPKQYTSDELKRVIVGAIISEVCYMTHDPKLQKHFPECFKLSDQINLRLGFWSAWHNSRSQPAHIPGDLSFTINREPGVLTPPQTQLFETLNALMKEMDISPAVMDSAFRFEALRMKNWMDVEEAEWVRKNPDKVIKSESVKSIDTRMPNNAEMRLLSKSIPGYDVRVQDPRNLSVVKSQTYDQALYYRFGHTGITLPPYADELSQSAYKSLVQNGHFVVHEQGGEFASHYENTLQTYASGRLKLHSIPLSDNVDENYGRETKLTAPKSAVEVFENAPTRMEKLEASLLDVSMQVVDAQRPAFDDIFELAFLGAIDELAKYKYPEGTEPLRVRQLRTKLQDFFTPVVTTAAVINSGNAILGVVFKNHDVLYLMERNRNMREKLEIQQETNQALREWNQKAKAEVAAAREAGRPVDVKKLDRFEMEFTAAKAAIMQSRQETPSKEENIPAVVAQNGVVIQRIFRAEGTAHRNNSRERNDDIVRMEWLGKQLRALGSLECMNSKFAPHAELAAILFSDEVLRPLEYAHAIFTSSKDKDRFPTISPETRERLVQALQQVFAIGNGIEGISPDDLKRNDELKRRILEFPGLVIAVLGNEKDLRKLRDKYALPLVHGEFSPCAVWNTVKREALAMERDEKAKSMLADAGIWRPPLEPVTEFLPQPIEESPAAIAPPEQNAATAQTEEGIQTPRIFESIISAESSTPSAGEIADIVTSATPAPALSEDEKFEMEIKRLEAFDEALEYLIGDARMHLMQAQNAGFNQFDCRLNLTRSGFPIELLFSKEVNVEGQIKTKRMPRLLTKGIEAYDKRDIPLTLTDAVDLKIYVQSVIYSAAGIVPARRVMGSGNIAVMLDTPIPLPIIDYDIQPGSNGMYTMVCESQNPYTRESIYTKIPLGIAARHEDEGKERRELEKRAEFVFDFLHKKSNERTKEGYGIVIKKRDVTAQLQSELEKQDREWVTAERMALPGFESPSLIHVSPDGSQKITLAPISLSMDIGGDNPSWHCNLPFYIGDKNKPAMGELVRTRSLNLRTRHLPLAIARARETLMDVKWPSGAERLSGFLPSLQKYMASTNDEWRIVSSDKNVDQVFIGQKPLQDFLEDMMRYERDVGAIMDKREMSANGDIKLTIQVVRGQIRDLGETTSFSPEYLYECDAESRKPIAYTVGVPGEMAGRIGDFLKAVDKSIHEHAEEAYCSREVNAPDTRKPVQEYRTATIRNSAIGAIKAEYRKYFGQRLPKDWHKAVHLGGVLPAELTEARARRRHHAPTLPENEDRSARYVRRARNNLSNYALG